MDLFLLTDDEGKFSLAIWLLLNCANNKWYLLLIIGQINIKNNYSVDTISEYFHLFSSPIQQDLEEVGDENRLKIL